MLKMILSLFLMFCLNAKADPPTQEAKTVFLGIADVKALMPQDSTVGDCSVNFVPSKNITGGTDIIIKDTKTGETAIKTFNPNFKRNLIQKVLGTGQEKVQGIYSYPHSTIGGNWDPKEIEKYGWIDFYGDANNSDGFTGGRKVDLTFYYDDRTQRITGLEYRDITDHLFSKPDMSDFLACGNVKEKETQRVKRDYNLTGGAAEAMK